MMKTILLIEDNSDIRENTHEMLELKGYSVIAAMNGKAGINLAKEKKPDIILCDILMPEANGFEVFNALKNNISTAGIPFIFLTANAERSEADAGLEMGANGYIKKPFEPEELFDTISQCLKNDK